MAVQRLLIAALLLGAAYAIYMMFSKTKDSFAIPTPLAAGPVLEAPLPRGSMDGAAGGPNTPTQAGGQIREAAAVIEARDPYSETVDSADAPERITHPENYYGPAVVPEAGARASMIDVEAGLAGASSEPGPYNGTLFTPEMVSNGAAMNDGVMAAEPTHGLSFSAL
jgi:hypothetical protein